MSASGTAGSSRSAAPATRTSPTASTPALQIGPSTDVISGKGKILTAGGIDSHVHLISPQQILEALAAGMTTLVGGGTGPAEGTKATTVTPGAWHWRRSTARPTRTRSTCCCSARATRVSPRA